MEEMEQKRSDREAAERSEEAAKEWRKPEVRILPVELTRSGFMVSSNEDDLNWIPS